MGLDQYAYAAEKASEDHGARIDLAYWRKHPNLHGWMQRLWESRGGTGMFNGDEIELSWGDLDALELDIKNGTVADMDTTGFFFGLPSDHYYYDQDIEFIKEARLKLFLGFKVFYNSSW